MAHRTFIDMRCAKCGAQKIDAYVTLADASTFPVCCEQPMERLFVAQRTGGVIQDSIEGGIEIKHGICNPDGTPRKYYSKTEIRKAAKAAGFDWGYDRNEHVPVRGTDKGIPGGTRKW